MTSKENQLAERVESLCSHGCERVSVYIADLKAGRVFAEVADLNLAERRLLLDELVAVMAPYTEEGED
jgi:hypothetical protein